MESNLLNAKIELIQWLTTLEDSTLIQKIIELRKNETKDWWNEISEDEKESIELGIADAENGNLQPNSAAKKVYGKWL
ncbi:MAG: hypothetical protein H6553_01125 [Chitinophagales bacterium]|nr:hypothetical protein [Chitinophagales bacterium]